MTKKHFISSKLTTLVILLISVILFFGCNEKKSALDPKNPTTVTIWYYYSGTQATAFENMIEAFNSTVGI
jgi:multiple sugar transport system substrate-binding protein